MKFLSVIMWGIALNLPSSQTTYLSLDVMWFEVVALGASGQRSILEMSLGQKGVFL